MSDLKNTLKQDMIAAMKAGNKELLATIRSINALIKQYEVDERMDADDTKVISLLEKARKQRIESIKQFQQAGRDDLVKVEQSELTIIESYLPEKISQQEIQQTITDIMAKLQPTGLSDMGKVMTEAKARLQGRADMAIVSQLVKKTLR